MPHERRWIEGQISSHRIVIDPNAWPGRHARTCRPVGSAMHFDRLLAASAAGAALARSRPGDTKGEDEDHLWDRVNRSRVVKITVSTILLGRPAVME